MFDLFTGSDGLLDNADQENESRKQRIEIFIANPAYQSNCKIIEEQ